MPKSRQIVDYRAIEESFTNLTNEIVQRMARLLGRQDPAVIEELSYAEVIQYFVGNRPSSSSGITGVMLRQPHFSGYLLSQVYLGKDGQIVYRPFSQIPYGRQVLVKHMDEELEALFSDKQLVLVK